MSPLDPWADKPKRKTLTKTEWDIKKKRGCIICGGKDVLVKAHIRAHSKGGTQIEAMCPNHHSKYDRGLLTDTELRKLGISRKAYVGGLPKIRKKKKRFDW